MRAKNGHPQPYKVKYWQVGNERSGADYERVLPEFCKAMKKVDPNIKLLGSYPSKASARGELQYIHFICPHHYTPDFAEMLRISGLYPRFDPAVRRRQADQGRHHRVEQHRRRCGTQGSMLWDLQNGLFAARYHNFLHRNCDLVEIACRSNLI